jgi:hypothetical protein
VRTETLFPEPPVPPAKRGLLADLDVEDDHYVLDVAVRIAAIEDLGKVEAALAEVPNRFKKTVLTIVINGIALRIAQMPQLLERKAALEALPPDLRDMTAPHVKRLYTAKPWEGKKWKGRQGT